MSLLNNNYENNVLKSDAYSVKRHFTKRYLVAISLIALLATAAFVILKIALNSSDSTAYIVNISGKQRMLSQRIASFSQQYHYANYENIENKTINKDELKIKLKTTIDEMKGANITLSSGIFENIGNIELSEEIYEIYYKNTNLKERVEQYLDLAQKILDSNEKDISKQLLEQLLNISNGLLVSLNEAVLQYQKEGEEKISLIQFLEMIAWIITIFTLILEIIFIFKPMANKIFNLFQEIESMKNNLEKEVNIRTCELEKTNAKLNYLASHDPLTGVKNRLNLEIELKQIMELYNKDDINFCVAIFDIDWFKKINDNYGHDTGDFVLKEVTNVFRGCIKEHDNVYRTGGEEFVVVLTNVDYANAFHKIETIRDKIEKNIFNYKKINLTLTISAGFYHPSIIKTDDINTILKLADNALYRAKHTGRNKILPVSI